MDLVRIFLITGFTGFLLWSLIERFYSLSGRQQAGGEKKEGFSFWLVSAGWYGAVGFALLDAWALQLSTFQTPLLCLRIPGAILIITGLALRYIARKDLGAQYSVYVQTSSEHRLVTGGIYSSIRHPAYLGLICLTMGIPLCEGSWGGLAIAALLAIPAIIHRIVIEEKALLQWFGSDYAVYANKTRRLIPKVW